MTWNAALIDSLLNSTVVDLGAAVLGTMLGLVLALSVAWFRVFGARMLCMIVFCFCLIPLYVQATAWSAGFGVQGWFRLSQVSAAVSPVRAIASAIWMHGVGVTPICFVFCLVGLSRSIDHSCELACLEFGPGRALWLLLTRKASIWIAAGFLFAFCSINNDMVVTNLFQIPTITESVYQQVQFNKIRSEPVAVAIGVACVCGVLVGALATRLRGRIGSENDSLAVNHNAWLANARLTRQWMTFIAWLIASVLFCVPIACLVIKIGWYSRGGVDLVQQGWSLEQAVGSMSEVSSFRNELGWSVLIGVYSAFISLLMASVVICFDRNRATTFLIFTVLGAMLAMPGPLVNLFVIWIKDRNEPAWVGYVSDHTLAAPLLALQSRCLPVVFAVVWIAVLRYRSKYRELLRMDEGHGWWRRLSVGALGLRGPWVASAVVAFFVAFSDLASYLLVQPPQVTTIAMRMFDLLHYGIRNQESSLALALAIASVLPTYALMRFVLGKQ